MSYFLKENMGEKMQEFHDNDVMNRIPLGVSKLGNFVYFAISIPNAQECYLLLFNNRCKDAKRRIHVTKEHRIGSIFRTCIPLNEFEYDSYLYEVDGIELIDPYAKRLLGRENYGKMPLMSENRLLRGGFDFDEFLWYGDLKLEIPYSELTLYKLHVRGFTKDASSKVKHGGTYLGLIEKIPYLKELGINAILLMPSVEFSEVMDETNNAFYKAHPYTSIGQDASVRNGKVVEPKLNFWGYTENYYYFCPKTSYAFDTENPNQEFKMMVREFHKHGMEVHMEMHFTKGISFTLIQDCLRFWSMEYHIDGFRCTNDLGVEDMLASDPYLARTKLLHYAWNTDSIYDREKSPEYKILAEYNDCFSNDMKRFLKGDEGQLTKFVQHLLWNDERKTCIHYITEHNGFTLMDLYSYDMKHNEDNGENNLDGTDYNYSWNCGEEGQTKKQKIIKLRTRMRKNALLILLLSQGVPMIYAGDEFGNSQQGNNNAYCLDNSLSWLNWRDKRSKDSLFAFTKQLISLRKKHKILRYDKSFQGIDTLACGYPDISFHGTMAWRPEYFTYSRTLGVLLSGEYVKGEKESEDDSFYFIFNMHWEAHRFDLPLLKRGYQWMLMLATEDNTTMEDGKEDESMKNLGRSSDIVRNLLKKQCITLSPRTIVILKSYHI